MKKNQQDWPLEISHEISMRQCLQEYPQLTDDDEKFLVMWAILYVLDYATPDDFNLYSPLIVGLLNADFALHSYTVYYWTLYEEGIDLFDGGFRITPLMREVWDSRHR